MTRAKITTHLRRHGCKLVSTHVLTEYRLSPTICNCFFVIIPFHLRAWLSRKVHPYQTTEKNGSARTAILSHEHCVSDSISKQYFATLPPAQWLSTGVPRHPRTPFTIPRGAAS